MYNTHSTHTQCTSMHMVYKEKKKISKGMDCKLLHVFSSRSELLYCKTVINIWKQQHVLLVYWDA